MISVIIPSYKEKLERTINVLREKAKNNFEIIVVTATDDVVPPGVKKIYSNNTSRPLLLNKGAKSAKGDVLLFLHADTILPKDWDVLVIDHIKKYDAGAFYKKFDSNNPLLAINYFLTNIRAKFTFYVYGDNSFFLKKSKFIPFRDIPIFDDVEYVTRLKKSATCKMLDATAITSSRRFLKSGILRVLVLMQLATFLYWCRVSPQKISRIYKRYQK